VLARLGWKTPRGLGDSRGLRGREAAERPGLAAAWTGRSPPCSSAFERKRAGKTGSPGARGEAIVASGARGPRASTSKGVVWGRFPGPHRALPQGGGAAPVHLAGALGLNATPQAPAGVLNLEAHSGSPLTNQLVWSLAEALELTLLIFAEELPRFRARSARNL
jgi:hypothetical protein